MASSIINNLCRSAPFLNISHTEMEYNKTESWEKEILATTGPDRPQVLDYSVWFSDDASDCKRPLSPYVLPAPDHNLRIRASFNNWKKSFNGRLLFPQTSANQSVSRFTAAKYQYRVHDQEIKLWDVRVSTSDLERYYSESGVWINGPCELRQAWKYNELTPRTYFSQGGTTFHSSKYIRQPINELTNAFPEVNFLSRFSFHDLALDDDTTAYIYDYTSFTSLLAEQKYFLEALADFCDDTEVYLVDSYNGIIQTTLGQVFRDYNNVCNKKGEFTIQRYLEEELTPLRHEIASFLGIYGNIASCTTIHGLHACQICGDDSRCRCVGDDVFGILKLGKDYTQEEAIVAIEKLGKIQRAKIKWWPFRRLEDETEEDHAWPYVKRPMDRFNNRMTLEPALFLPIFGLICPIDDIIQREREDTYTRVKLLATQTYSLIKQAQNVHPPLGLYQKDFLQVYLLSLYRALGIHSTGYLPFETFFVDNRPIRNLFVPNVEDKDFLDVDPWALMQWKFDAKASFTVTVPKMVDELMDNSDRIFRTPNFPFETTMTKALSYCDSMGWAISEEIKEEKSWSFLEYKSFYERLFAGDLLKVYSYRIIVSNLVIQDLQQFYSTGTF